MSKADLVLFNANVITMDKKDTRAKAIAINGDRILKVGSENSIKTLMSETTETIDLDGKTVIPGLIDTHIHTGKELGFDAAWIHSIKELQDKLALYALRVPKERYIKGIRFDPMYLKEKRWPTRAELDKVTPDHFLSLTMWGGHGCIVNTKLLEFMKATNEEGIEKDPKTGEPTGVIVDPGPQILEALIDKCWPKTDDVKKQTYIDTAEEAAQVGLTTLHIAGSDEFVTQFVLSQPLAARFIPYFRILASEIEDEKIVDEKLRLVKSLSKEYNARIGIKIINDGDFDPHTAALFEPYTDHPTTKGMLYLTQDKLNWIVSKIHEMGFQIAIHCCGERCIEAVLDAYENAIKKYPRLDSRHRIEHTELVTEKQINRTAKLGVAWAMQPNFLFYLDYTPYIGEKRMKRIHPYKAILKAGVLVAGGSDSYVTPMDPILGIYVLVNHHNPEQRISVKDALKLYTINAAKIGFEEMEKGSLEPGKLADLVVLSDDPYRVEPKNIRNIQIVLTIVGGRIVYRSNRLLKRYV